jgi:hypothetical protein
MHKFVCVEKITYGMYKFVFVEVVKDRKFLLDHETQIFMFSFFGAMSTFKMIIHLPLD